MRSFILALAIGSCFVGCPSNEDVPPAYVARCDMDGGAAPPRGDLAGVYYAKYYFLHAEVGSCDEARAAQDAYVLTVIDGKQNYTLKAGEDPGVEANYVANPIANLTDQAGNLYRHQLIDGKPGYISASGAQCIAEKVRPLNKPTGMNAAEFLLKVVSCDQSFSLIGH